MVKNMRIRKIILAKKASEAVDVKAEQDSCLYLFKSPMIFKSGSEDKVYSGTTAIICDKAELHFKGITGRGLRYDMVSFRLSSADRQYISSMNVPFNVPIEVQDDFVLTTAVKSMKLQWDSAANRRSELGELYMRIIFIELENLAGLADAPQRSIPKYGKLKELREAIYSDPLIDRSVEDVCEWLEISRSYFHRLYTQAFGVTFSQDVIESRLMYASELLKNTDKSVSAIAEICGYESDAYFMRQFRQHRGCTPTEYRRKTEENV